MSDDTQLLKGILEGCILELLSKEPAYGYRIVEVLTDIGIETNEATVYPILIRLQKQGALFIEKRPSPLGPDRKYYSLTAEGVSILNRFRASWTKIRLFVEQVQEREIL